MKKMMRRYLRSFKSGSQEGFSLIELAIGLVIIGILTVPLINIYQEYEVKKVMDETQMKMNDIREAIFAYHSQFGRYPCPADRSIGVGEPGYGRQVCVVTDVNPDPDIVDRDATINPPIPETVAIAENSCRANNGYCRYDFDPTASPRNPDTEVYIGGVPYRDLGMVAEDVVDGNGAMITYAVTAVRTSMPRTRAYNAANSETDYGAIPVENILDDGTVETRDAIFTLVSHGSDHEGAFTMEGESMNPCDTTELDGQNCNDTTTFLINQFNLADGINQYDDVLTFGEVTAATIWRFSDQGDGSIFTMNNGPVGINTETPRAELDVNGNVLATQVAGQQICQAGTSNCFQPNMIAGSGLTCPTGQFLVGVANSAPICRPMTLNVIPGICNSPEVLIGINSDWSIRCAVR
jgi:prepilin-type N-terminal cleavage/methylation domain-containing protein